MTKLQHEIKCFEDYIEDLFLEEDGAMVLDDNLSDAFGDYLADLSVEDWIEFGDEYRDYLEWRIAENSRRK